MRFFILLLALCSISPAFAQLVEFPLSSHQRAFKVKAAGNHSARTQSSEIILPFWDDFSYSDTQHVPDSNIWAVGNTLFLNNGIGINPPSKNVVTFDGLNAFGKPYNISNNLAKGGADTLASKPIRLDLVDPALRSTVFLSFFYQIKGLGEVPDAGDQLIVSYKNAKGKWIPVYTIDNTDTTKVTNTFYQVVIPVPTDTSNVYFHNAFQFQFSNLARLSGAYDTWSLDYIYLNVNRNTGDTSYPDRTISSSLNSLFVDYYSIPYKHFRTNPTINLKVPEVTLYNLRAVIPQTFSFSTYATIETSKNSVTTQTTMRLDSAVNPNAVTLPPQKFTRVPLNNIPSSTSFDLTADSVAIRLKYALFTGDNVPLGPTGDYDASKYAPIDFRVNDTIQNRYKLSSYYAYDDGQAEYAFKLSQSGSFLAFKYLYKAAHPDTLVGVQIYFPLYADNTSQSFLLQVRSDLSDTPGSILYQQTAQVMRRGRDTLSTYRFNPAILIGKDFYIGWKQLSNAVIPVGLDKNNDNGDKFYYNVSGTWIQNTSIVGSPMVRPVFGTGNPPLVTGVENERRTPVYPNPTTGVCYIQSDAQAISAIDITGRKLDTEITKTDERTAITFPQGINGLVILRYFLNGKSVVEKVMVLVR